MQVARQAGRKPGHISSDLAKIHHDQSVSVLTSVSANLDLLIKHCFAGK